MDECIKNCQNVCVHTCTMEYNSAMRKKDTLPLATIWINLESIMLSEINQMEKDKYHMVSIIYGN